MDTVNGASNSPPKQLTPESTSLLAESINLVLSRWYTLKIYLEQEADSHTLQKAEHLYNEILSWFIKSKDPRVDFYDLVDMIEDRLLLFFGIDTEDDESNEIELVAGHLISIYEDLLEGKYEEIERLRTESNKVKPQVVSQIPKVANEGCSADDEAVDMSVDEQKPTERVVVVVEAEEGWEVVPTRRRNRPSNH